MAAPRSEVVSRAQTRPRSTTMRFVTEVHYSGCRTCHIDAESAEDAERQAKEQHHASTIGGNEDLEEVTFVRAVPIPADAAAANELTYDDEGLMRFAKQVGICPGCGTDYSKENGGPDADPADSDGCDDPEGCGALR